MKKTMVQSTLLIVVTAGALVAVWFIVSPTPLGAYWHANQPLLIEQEPSLEGESVLLVSEMGRVALHDSPQSTVVRFTVAAGTLALVVDGSYIDNQFWYLVRLEDGAQGWVPAAHLSRPNGQGISFDHFTFCTGTSQGPSAQCGTQLALAQGQGLWLRWQMAGLKPNDLVQHVLVVGDERYASDLTRWTGPQASQALVNLMDLAPRHERGLWTVWFIVNGEMAGATSVRVQ